MDYFDIENAVKTSIVTFANEAKLVMPLKNNPMTRITNRLANLYAQREQESSLNDALKMVNGLLDVESESGKAVIVMSDFWSTEGEFPNQISIKLAKKGNDINFQSLSHKIPSLHVDVVKSEVIRRGRKCVAGKEVGIL